MATAALRLEILFWDGWIGLLRRWGPHLPARWSVWLRTERRGYTHQVGRWAALGVVLALVLGGLLGLSANGSRGRGSQGEGAAGGAPTRSVSQGSSPSGGVLVGVGVGAIPPSSVAPDVPTGVPLTGVPPAGDSPTGVSPTGAPPTGAPPEVKTGQRNLLLIVVDRQGERAQLEGVWLGVILPPTPRLLWLPIYPSASALDVAAAFALADGVPVEAFWETLRERQLWWDTSLVVGREEIEALGAPGTAAWPWGASATEGATRAQAAFLVDACANGGATALARGWLGDNLPGGGAALSCEFPTLGRIP